MKIASSDGWSRVQDVVALLPGGPFKVGDRVVYNPEIKWTNEPDGKHTGGGWEGSDFKKDGVSIGARGVVTDIKGKTHYVLWDQHAAEHPDWTHAYREYELKKVPAVMKKVAAEKLKGGLADGLPDKAFSSKSLKKGMKVEAEHTKSKRARREIAKDHLVEDPRYYDKLERMEKSAFSVGFEKVSAKIRVPGGARVAKAVAAVPTAAQKLTPTQAILRAPSAALTGATEGAKRLGRTFSGKIEATGRSIRQANIEQARAIRNPKRAIVAPGGALAARQLAAKAAKTGKSVTPEMAQKAVAKQQSRVYDRYSRMQSKQQGKTFAQKHPYTTAGLLAGAGYLALRDPQPQQPTQPPQVVQY